MRTLGWIVAVLAAMCCSMWAIANAKGFLESEVPLEVIASTPTDLMTTTEPLIFSGAATITVVFSRSVIALGSDFGEKDLPKELVPFRITQPEIAVGRFRWVTTSIARWDPVDSWPPDAKVTLQWNRDLKTYGGIPFNITTPDAEIHTPPLSVFVHGVASGMAMNLTDDHWEASTGMEDDLLPEMPPDGKIVVGFSFPVEIAAIEKGVKIAEVDDSIRKDTQFQAKAEKCLSDRHSVAFSESNNDDEATCLAISIANGVLERGIRYEAIFPKGLRYNPRAGALTEEVSFHFYGLRDFRIPFHPTIDIKGTIIDMWLPHGLASGTSVNDLKGAFSLTKDANPKPEEIAFELSLKNKGILSLTAPFYPEAQYKLTVNEDPNLRDGFGLPLKSTKAPINARELDQYLVTFQPFESVVINSEDGWDGKYSILSALHSGGYALQAKKISPQTLDEALSLGYAFFYSRDKLQKQPDLEIPLIDSKASHLTTVDLSPLLEQYGMIYAPMKRPDDWDYVRGTRNENKIVQTDFQVAHIVWDKGGNKKVTLFFTGVSDGKPYSNATVTVMRRQDKSFRELDWEQEDKLEHVSSLTTDADGLAEFFLPGCSETSRCSDYVYWVRKGKTNNMFSEYIYSSRRKKFQVDGAFILDRKVVEPGDEVKIGGFLTKRDGYKVWPFNLATGLTIAISPRIGNQDEIKAYIDPQYGTFTASIKIPKDAEPGNYFIYTGMEGEDYQTSFSESFVVGRPRIPTARLTLLTPPWVKPNSTFEVEVQASSLLGPFVANAEMTLQWKLTRSWKEIDEHVEVVETNTTGGLSYIIDLGNVTEPAKTGDTVDISVTWIGPTRERIKESATLRVQPTNMAVSLDRSLRTNLPDIEFGGWVSVTRTTEAGVIPLEGFPVSLQLLAIPDSVDTSDVYELKAKLSDPIYDATFSVEMEKRCTALAGVPESEIECRFQLPKMGHYCFRACAIDSIENVTVCSADIIGKTLKEFKENPVTKAIDMNFHSESNEIDPSTMQAQIWVDIPFQNARLVASWGNFENYQRKVMNFPEKGMHKIELDGNLCIGGCHVATYLAVPQQNKDFAKGIPHSFYRSPDMPHEFEDYKSFTIANETVPFTLNITSGISTSNSNDVTPLPGIDPENPAIDEPFALMPGENATILFNVRKCPGDPSDPTEIACPELENVKYSQVLVAVVDKAYLELIANPLVDLVEELMTQIPARVSLDGFPGSDSWMDPDGYAAAKDLFLKRIEKDPWLALDMMYWSGTVTSQLSKPDEYFFSRNAQEGTIGPLYASQLSEVWEALGRIPHKNRLPLTGPSSRSPTEATSDETVEPKLRVKGNFKTTPIFKTIQVGRDGFARVNLTAPENLGTFAVRAYASSDLAQRGSFESEIVVRLPLSLTSSAPRFVRIGDDFEAGVVVTINKKVKEGVPVVVTLLSDPEKARNIEYQPDNGSSKFARNCEDPSGLSCLVQLDMKQINTDVDGQVEVRFKFTAARLGNADLTIRADIAGASDALKVLIPVHGQQKPVQIATSFALRGKPAEEASPSTTPVPIELKTYYSSKTMSDPRPAASVVVINHARKVPSSKAETSGNSVAKVEVRSSGNVAQFGGFPKNKHGQELSGNTVSRTPSIATVAYVKRGVELDGRTLGEENGVLDAVEAAKKNKERLSFGRKLRQRIGVRSIPASDFSKENPTGGGEAVSKKEKRSFGLGSGLGGKGGTYQKIVASERVTNKAPIAWISSDRNSTEIPSIGQDGLAKSNGARPLAENGRLTSSSHPGKTSSETGAVGDGEEKSEGQGAKKAAKISLGLYGVQGKSSANRRKSVAQNGSNERTDILHQSEENVEWDEGLKFPKAAPGSGSLKLLAGVGRFPSVLHGVEKALEQWSPWWISLYDALANITTPFILQQYGTDNPEAADHSTYKKAVGAFEIGVKNLESLTTDDCGLKSGDYSYYCETWMINFWTNSWGLWIAAGVMERTETASDEALKGGVDKVEQLSKLWQKRMVEKVKYSADEDWSFGYHLSVFYAIELRFVLGVDWIPPSNFPERIKADLSMDRVSAELQKNELSMKERAKVSLAWLKKLGKVEGAKHADVVDSVTAFRNAIRTIGRTAYVAWSPQTAAPVGHSTQALILLVFVRSGESGPLVEKLANYVASPSRWYSSEATILTNLALSEYDKATGSTDPDLDFTARSGDITVLQGSFTSPSDPMLSNSTSFESLSDSPKPLMCKVEGKGEATIVATLDFVPADLLPFPSYRGIYVERIIQTADADGNPTGPPLKTVPLGKPVTLTIQVTSPDQLGGVSLTAMMPGGMEPIDPLVERDSDAQTTCTMDRLGIHISWWWWDFCPTQRTTPEEVTFHYGALMPGTSTIQLQAIAASVGNWKLPPVYAVVDEQPEVMGMSSAGSFTVCDSTLPDCEAVSAEKATLPKECPDDCSGVGECDLNTGQCNCEAGFTGENCGELQDE